MVEKVGVRSEDVGFKVRFGNRTKLYVHPNGTALV